MDDTAALATTSTAPEAAEDAFGLGAVPERIRRFSWPAMLWGPIWAFAYGLWGWFALFVVLGLTSLPVGVIVAKMLSETAPWLAPLVTASTNALYGVVVLWFGTVANRRLWALESGERRGKRVAMARPAYFPVDHFWQTQLGWGLSGVALWALSLGLAIFEGGTLGMAFAILELVSGGVLWLVTGPKRGS